MPCYQVNTISVKFEAKNFELLERTAAALKWSLMPGPLGTATLTAPGWKVVTIGAGMASGRSEMVNELRVAYAREVVSQAQKWAQEKGWQVEKSRGNKITLSRLK